MSLKLKSFLLTISLIFLISLEESVAYEAMSGEKKICIQYAHTGLILERAHEPDALYFAVGLSCFVGCEPGRLPQIRRDIVPNLHC